MHHCVVRRSESVPSEITEPTREAQSSRHVFIETLQSKDFSENLAIYVNFQTQPRIFKDLKDKNHILNNRTQEILWVKSHIGSRKFASPVSYRNISSVYARIRFRSPSYFLHRFKISSFVYIAAASLASFRIPAS